MGHKYDVNIHASKWLVLLVPIRKLCLYFAVLFNLNLGGFPEKHQSKSSLSLPSVKKIGNV